MRLTQRIEQQLFNIVINVARSFVFLLECFIEIKNRGFFRSIFKLVIRAISQIFEGLALFLEQFKSPILKYPIRICWKLEHFPRFFERYLFPLVKEPEYNNHPFLLVRKYLFLRRKFRKLYLFLKKTFAPGLMTYKEEVELALL
jgi:hypothetical protein